MPAQDPTAVTTLGERRIPSPLDLSSVEGDGRANFIRDDARVLREIVSDESGRFDTARAFEQAGPREEIFFDPSRTTAAVVTCGGLSPGLNNVIRAIFLELHFHYGIRDVIGFRYGYRGIHPDLGEEPVHMSLEYVRKIHEEGGSVLGCSRGGVDAAVIADRLEELGVDVLFCVGGDGTLRGAHAIWEEAARRGGRIAIVGVPKTIDNDVAFTYRTFGFDTAVGVVQLALEAAHVEATGTPNGIGLVKVMGRDAGFIACHGTLASGEANFCLIPEVPFDLEGDGALLDLLEGRIRERGHAVLCVAEGAGQHLFDEKVSAHDPSGNVRRHDIGVFLRDAISRHFEEREIEINLKYIDPSYMIRSVKANASDAILCNILARHAVHAGMAGKTDVIIGVWHGRFVHVPIPMAISRRKQVNPESLLWRDVLAATGQPAVIAAR